MAISAAVCGHLPAVDGVGRRAALK